MTIVDPDLTLGELVASSDGAAAVLDRWRLDYCCQGGRTLREACAADGIDLSEVTASLSDAVGSDRRAPWADMDPLTLIDHLLATHHQYLWGELPRLEQLAERVVAVHGDRHPELFAVAACQRELRTDLEAHLTKEERVLFPMIRGLLGAGRLPPTADRSLQAPISVMLAEHDHAGDLLARLRRLTGDYAAPLDACASYREWYRALEALELDTHRHVSAENHGLFPQIAGHTHPQTIATLAG